MHIMELTRDGLIGERRGKTDTCPQVGVHILYIMHVCIIIFGLHTLPLHRRNRRLARAKIIEIRRNNNNNNKSYLYVHQCCKKKKKLLF